MVFAFSSSTVSILRTNSVGCDSLNATNHNQIINGIFVLLQRSVILIPNQAMKLVDVSASFASTMFASLALG
jgi:hypothetical protein